MAENEHHEVNRRWWDAATPIHVASKFYDVDGFISDSNAVTVGQVERDALGNVQGKRVLHLQCHFGQDSISWARLGANVTGVDFSPEAIRAAERLKAQAVHGGSVNFVCQDVTAGQVIDGGQFDIVFTSLGTIVWLSSLEGWASTIRRNLADNGFFYFLDQHPTTMLFDEGSTTPIVKYGYFHEADPVYEQPGMRDYADPDQTINVPAHEFTWGLADIFAALEAEGMRIFEVREYPFGAWGQFPDMEKSESGYWVRTADVPGFPLLLAFKARP